MGISPLPAWAQDAAAPAGAQSDLTELFASDAAWEEARQAVLKLSAVDAPAGSMTVVFGPGWPGILLHEAVGHGLEADFNRKQTSNYSGRVGKPVASSLCTIVDDGTIDYSRGSINVDDEGNPTGHGIIFIGPAGQVYCYVTPGGV